MKYEEFRNKIGKLTVPTGQIEDELIEGLDSIHFVIVVGRIKGDTYEMLSPVYLDEFVSAIELLDARQAERDKDYIVTGNVIDDKILVGLHSTHKFLSDEDFALGIKRVDTK